MTIQILPARLANQIAAGEVVERPASVVKELVENSLDAGASQITIDIEKGGAKRIRITDNGKGIDKSELALALSRHATSKIKSLDDLEAIASLGFRGEALASISSVSRLTLTSKPAQQDTAWQATTEGRDMEVVLKPAAHPNGTTIDVQDLFFNTPARRKFLRTEKTEFNHIEEVIKRIALAEFGVSFTLNHNGKKVKQFRAISDKAQYVKRVAAVCGKAFIDHVIELDCQHHDIHLWGWVAKPGFHRNHNDLSYSYVNGRMMRDKLINHAIRQAYAHLLPEATYPAFVLYLELDHKEVDVNVHPAKHEVRFHQGRYVHDFIFSVIEKSLIPAMEVSNVAELPMAESSATSKEAIVDYIAPLSYQTSTQTSGHGNSLNYQTERAYSPKSNSVKSINELSNNYQSLMTPINQTIEAPQTDGGNAVDSNERLLTLIDASVALIERDNSLYCAALNKLAKHMLLRTLVAKYHQGLISQPLLLPISVKLDSDVIGFVESHSAEFQQLGFQFQINKSQCQLRQCPAQLRNRDIAKAFLVLIEVLQEKEKSALLADIDWCEALAQVACHQSFDLASAQVLFLQAKSELNSDFSDVLDLISVPVDLTSTIKQVLE